MKVASLLAQYLYINKQLDLPGLGYFLLDPSSDTVAESNKHNKTHILEGVTFESNTTVKELPELVQYISAQTGKIKALAAADLESHLGLALQFLNIGKPFLFEGIGTLTKISSGEFSFKPGLAIAISEKELITRDTTPASFTEQPLGDYKSILYNRKQKITWKKPVFFLLLLTGLALAIWGGYTVYKKTTAKKETTESEENKKQKTVLVTDTAHYEKDNMVQSNRVTKLPAGNYKFVLETSDSLRAFSRLNRLKIFQWPAQMETKDSISFKIFMLLPANAADTSRIVDSLSRLNGKLVYIE